MILHDLLAAASLAALALAVPVPSQEPAPPTVVLPLRERAAVRDRVLRERLDLLVPRLMRREGVDLWIVSGREYAEDPVLETMLPATWVSARRRTVLVFADDGGEPERFAVSRYAVADLFPGAWKPEEQPDQLARLAELVRERDPERIALNVSSTFALADGLSHAEHGALIAALGSELAERVVPAERLAVGWLETRAPAEVELYPRVCALAHALLAEALSNAAVEPGVTTTEDLAWWLRERAARDGLEVWFHPDVAVQRAETEGRGGDFSDEAAARTILPGDLLWIDFGIRYLGLCTDMQQLAYVLREGEDAPPAGLALGLAAGNRMQELLLAELEAGGTGNDVLARARAAGERAGLRPTIYSHPLGLHGHGAGATIGLWDRQDGVPGTGDHPVQPDTAWSIELAVTVEVPEWGGQEVRIQLEEDAFFDGERARWIDGRQERLFVIR